MGFNLVFDWLSEVGIGTPLDLVVGEEQSSQGGPPTVNDRAVPVDLPEVELRESLLDEVKEALVALVGEVALLLLPII